ncbi:hypothetical protein NESM_000134100 [Novymonas esmeraldas]|uniref:Uncharacterized protein n=1 Tax=Novymonas esmeraldas TaxID=1808958 RepID=A0AAW0F6D8_9TRYP
MAAAPPSSAVDLLRFLALSLEVHADAVCCAVDDVEAAIVESSTNDELLDVLEEELVGLLDRQRRLHAARSVIALSQEERRRGMDVRRRQTPTALGCNEKRIQTSRAPSHVSGTGARVSPPYTGGSVATAPPSGAWTHDSETAEASMAGSSSPAPHEETGADSVDVQVAALKARIERLDRYSLRGKLLQLEKQKRAVAGVDIERVVAEVVDTFEFAAPVRALWAAAPAPPSDASRLSSRASQASPSRDRSSDGTLAQHATGKGGVVNHTNIDLLLARACQRLSGRAADALEALASTHVSEESPAAHVLGCMVYAGQFDASEGTDLTAVQLLQTMPHDTLSRLYAECVHSSVCEARLDDRCFGARRSVLAAQDFCALPGDWATTQSLARVPFDEVLPPVRHVLAPRFSFADVAELKQLQTRRVELQEKIVAFLLGGQGPIEELLRGVSGNERDTAAAAARLAVAEVSPASTAAHAWRTLVRQEPE